MKLALVHTGTGVGNVIMATPLMKALRRMGYVVDVFAHRKDVRYLGLVSGG